MCVVFHVCFDCAFQCALVFQDLPVDFAQVSEHWGCLWLNPSFCTKTWFIIFHRSLKRTSESHIDVTFHLISPGSFIFDHTSVFLGSTHTVVLYQIYLRAQSKHLIFPLLYFYTHWELWRLASTNVQDTVLCTWTDVVIIRINFICPLCPSSV